MKVRLMNKISQEGLKRLPADRYEVGEDLDHADAIMVRSASLNKRSLDARRKDHITWVSSVRLELEKNEEQLAARLADRLGTDRVKYWKEEPLCFCKGT